MGSLKGAERKRTMKTTDWKRAIPFAIAVVICAAVANGASTQTAVLKWNTTVPVIDKHAIGYENDLALVIISPHTSNADGEHVQYFNVTTKKLIDQYLYMNFSFTGGYKSMKLYHLQDGKWIEQAVEVNDVLHASIDFDTKKIPEQQFKIAYETLPFSSGKWDICISDGTDSNCIDPWWNSSWTFRAPINISSSLALTDYTLFLNVTYNTSMKNNFGDLRFSNEENSAEIPYWIDPNETMNGSYAGVYFKVDSIDTDNGTQAYMYYGNAAATTTGNENTTFLLYDNFEDNSVNTVKWSNQAGTATESSGRLAVGNNNVICTNASVITGNVSIQFKYYSWDDAASVIWDLQSSAGAAQETINILYTGDPGGGNDQLKIETVDNNNLDYSGGRTMKILRNETNWHTYRDGALQDTETVVTTAPLWLCFGRNTDSAGGTVEISKVMQYRHPEPTASFGTDTNSSTYFSVNNWTSPTRLLEGAGGAFTLNITAGSAITDISATLYFNGTAGATTEAVTSSYFTATGTSTFTAAANSSVAYYWQVNRTVGAATYSENVGEGTVPVFKMQLTNCTAGTGATNLSRTYYVLNESNSEKIPVSFNGLFTVWSTLSRTVQLNITNTNNMTLCIYPDWSNFNVNMSITYQPNATYSTYVNRTYVSRNDNLNTTNKTVNLYTTIGTSPISITVKDQSTNPVENVWIRVYSYVVGVGEGVEIADGLTNTEGKTTVSLVKNKYYNLYFYYNGNLVKTESQVYVDADSYTYIISLLSIGEWSDIYSKITHSCTYTSTNFTLACIYSDISGILTDVFLKVYEHTQFNETLLNCSATSTLASGRLACVFPSDPTSQIHSWILYGSYNGETIDMEQGTIGGESTTAYGVEGVLIAFFAMVGAVMMFTWKPSFGFIGIAIVMGIVWAMNLLAIALTDLAGIFVGCVIMAWVVDRVQV